MAELKSAAAVRERLKSAIDKGDKSKLEAAISESETLAYPELSEDLCKARDALEFLGGGRGG